MIREQTFSDYTYFEKSNMSYPNMLTPPSSSEDSPQSTYLVASPSSNTFEYENYEYVPVQSTVFQNTNSVIVDPNAFIVKTETPAKASLQFVEQPTDRFRFRYKSEMAGTHGSLTGMNSDKSRKPTYPTVELRNCGSVDKVVIRCSIYQTNANHKDMLPHAHRLMMKRGREEFDDPHDVEVGPEEGYRAVFQGMGIIHTAKRNIVSELLRKKIQLKKEWIARTESRVRDLTQKEIVEIKGLAESESKSINLNIVCLRFDAFIKEKGILFPICQPIFSHSINNLKSALTGDLKIVRLDHVVSQAKGNKEIFILVERVTKKNIKIRFYELDDDENVVWEGWGTFNDLDVHHQYAIVFKTPPYHDVNITSPVNVFIELVRPSDQARSEPREFRYIPNKNNAKPGQKRARYDYSSSSYDSSNVGSEELPAVINTLQIEHDVNMSLNNIPSGLSDELQKALTDINSEEFQQLHNTHGDEYTSLLENLETDGPNSNAISTRKRRTQLQVHEPIKMEVSKEDRHMAVRIVNEFRNFIKTTHKASTATSMLNKYFGADNCTNALHVCTAVGDNDSSMLLLKIIAYYKLFDLLDKTNDQKYTALHLAVMCHNHQLVVSLILCKAKISMTDKDLNTALHLALKSNVPIPIFEALLRQSGLHYANQIKDCVDMVNQDGNTALMIAVESNKLPYVKLLCFRGADVNKKQQKTGFVALRIAIEKQYLNILRYLLSLKQTDATIKDFTNISPLAAMVKSNNEEIKNSVENFMKFNNITLDVKEEPEESDEEMEIDFQDLEIKTEKLDVSPEELEPLYEGVTNLTPQCLDEVSMILDRHHSWRNFAQLLEMEHLVDSGMIKPEAKSILTHAIEANQHWTDQNFIYVIRNFLENLDEIEAVDIIDRMVYELKNKK